MTVNAAHVMDVLELGSMFSDYGDLWESICWRMDAKGEYAPITFFVNCNDFFAPAADGETIATGGARGLPYGARGRA